MIEMVIALAIVGAVAGVIAGLFGVGGGMILVPAFYYAFTTLGYAHQDLMQICLATSLATIVVTSLRSLSAHNKRGGVDWDVLRTWAPGIMIGALVSVAFAAQL
ncbi:MAG: sulfite exporter TauE/SafE family protein, partial [Rhodobacteraceae bacterium]|nr:sulfite exporter TauE/SafE family protein [Paracoccaceae bacterium]